MNEAMKLEHTESRRGYANRFKPKTVATRVGSIHFEVPQVREVEDDEGFYPRSLERRIRSERALKAAVAEMFVNGVAPARAR